MATACAGIAVDEAFEGPGWEFLFEVPVEAPSGIVQSMCLTEDFIILLENHKDGSGEPDLVRAYSRDDFSEVLRRKDADYGHANGMAYHPGKHEVAVAPYKVEDKEDFGCVYLMDPDTLEYRGKVKVLEDAEVLGIGYYGETDGYIIQTDKKDNYSFLVLDRGFQVVEDLGEYGGTCLGRNFQDLCVSGDYIVNFPLTLKTDYGLLVNIYSIPDKKLEKAFPVYLDLPEAKSIEPESICEAAPGLFYMAVKCQEGGQRKCKVYSRMAVYDFPALSEKELAAAGYGWHKGGDGRSGDVSGLAVLSICLGVFCVKLIREIRARARYNRDLDG